MTAFTNESIDLMEQIARDSSNVFNLTRRGYLLATRDTDIGKIIDSLHLGSKGSPADSIRIHKESHPASYVDAVSSDWEAAPRGVDVLSNQDLIRNSFPSLSHDIRSVLHVRRAGDINGQ